VDQCDLDKLCANKKPAKITENEVTIANQLRLFFIFVSVVVAGRLQTVANSNIIFSVCLCVNFGKDANFMRSTNVSNCVSICQSWWLCGLRRTSAAARLLGLGVQFQPGAWLSVACESYVFAGRGLCDGPIHRPEESYLECVCQ
jgi:hypothetical protein